MKTIDTRTAMTTTIPKEEFESNFIAEKSCYTCGKTFYIQAVSREMQNMFWFISDPEQGKYLYVCPKCKKEKKRQRILILAKSFLFVVLIFWLFFACALGLVFILAK